MPKQTLNKNQSAAAFYSAGVFASARPADNRKKSLTRRGSAKQIEKKNMGLDLGFPKIEEISYMHLKAQQQPRHDECVPKTPGHEAAPSSKAYLELQRKVSKLEATKKKQAQQIRHLQSQLASDDQNGACCCDELRILHDEKE